MKINIILISDLKDENIKILVQEYKKRISRFAEIGFIEIKNKKQSGFIKEIREKYKSSYFFILSEKGKNISSLELSEKLEKITNYNNSEISFLIGDADGFAEEDLTLADELLSLSKMIFPHELATLLTFEQVYRALSILNNHPYHRE